MPSPSRSVSALSPMPSPSRSRLSLGSSGKASWALGTPSPSRSSSSASGMPSLSRSGGCCSCRWGRNRAGFRCRWKRHRRRGRCRRCRRCRRRPGRGFPGIVREGVLGIGHAVAVTVIVQGVRDAVLVHIRRRAVLVVRVVAELDLVVVGDAVAVAIRVEVVADAVAVQVAQQAEVQLAQRGQVLARQAWVSRDRLAATAPPVSWDAYCWVRLPRA